MRTVAVLLGAAAVAGLVILAVAGLSGALALLLTGVGGVAMIALGATLGGRHTPNRPPVDPPTAERATSDDQGALPAGDEGAPPVGDDQGAGASGPTRRPGDG